MPVTIKTKNGTLFALIKGEIDHHTTPELRESIDDALVCAELCHTLCLDFEGVTFMDSSGVGLVMGRYKLAASQGKAVEVVNLSKRDFMIMKMSGLEKLACLKQKEV